MADEQQLSLGQQRVRSTFNPSGNAAVDQLKKLAADFIDSCELLKETGNNEKNRSLAIAQTHAEDAAMHAVKGATAPSVGGTQ